MLVHVSVFQIATNFKLSSLRCKTGLLIRRIFLRYARRSGLTIAILYLCESKTALDILECC